MDGFTKRVDGKKVFYIFDIPSRDDLKDAKLDATAMIREAIKKDRQLSYGEEYGPNYAIEMVRAREYADYVGAYATERNIHCFGCKGYSFYIDRTN